MVTNGLCALYCLISAMVGGTFGILISALFSASGGDDDDNE